MGKNSKSYRRKNKKQVVEHGFFKRLGKGLSKGFKAIGKVALRAVKVVVPIDTFSKIARGEKLTLSDYLNLAGMVPIPGLKAAAMIGKVATKVIVKSAAKAVVKHAVKKVIKKEAERAFKKTEFGQRVMAKKDAVVSSAKARVKARVQDYKDNRSLNNSPRNQSPIIVYSPRSSRSQSPRIIYSPKRSNSPVIVYSPKRRHQSPVIVYSPRSNSPRIIYSPKRTRSQSPIIVYTPRSNSPQIIYTSKTKYNPCVSQYLLARKKRMASKILSLVNENFQNSERTKSINNEFAKMEEQIRMKIQELYSRPAMRAELSNSIKKTLLENMKKLKLPPPPPDVLNNMILNLANIKIKEVEDKLIAKIKKDADSSLNSDLRDLGTYINISLQKYLYRDDIKKILKIVEIPPNVNKMINNMVNEKIRMIANKIIKISLPIIYKNRKNKDKSVGINNVTDQGKNIIDQLYAKELRKIRRIINYDVREIFNDTKNKNQIELSIKNFIKRKLENLDTKITPEFNKYIDDITYNVYEYKIQEIVSDTISKINTYIASEKIDALLKKELNEYVNKKGGSRRHLLFIFLIICIMMYYSLYRS